MKDPAIDTIAALATPAGRGGIGIVRVSGARARLIGERVLGSLPAARNATLCWFHAADGQPLDKGIALFFAAPHSYTGEDVLELQGHGGPVLMEMLLGRVLELGARHAEPGEFTRRAFLNDKMDLAQAEAVADLIDSSTRAAASAAARSLHGEFSARIHALVAALTDLRIHVEAAIDFPEEEIDFLSDRTLARRIDGVHELFDALLKTVHHGRLLRDGMTIVIAGRPNAGKSSLLNRLAGHDAAIVTEQPGTTRDVLREDIALDGMPLRIVDTAGIRDSDDPIEREGVRRARLAIDQADRVLLIVDATDKHTPPLDQLPRQTAVTIVRNKIDLTDQKSSISTEIDAHGQAITTIALSALTGDGLDLLRDHLKASVGYEASSEGNLIARRRHIDALRLAFEHLQTGELELREHAAGEIMAEELRLAQRVLGEITGEVSSDDLLGEIFSRHCIGK